MIAPTRPTPLNNRTSLAARAQMALLERELAELKASLRFYGWDDATIEAACDPVARLLDSGRDGAMNG